MKFSYLFTLLLICSISLVPTTFAQSSDNLRSSELKQDPYSEFSPKIQPNVLDTIFDDSVDPAKINSTGDEMFYIYLHLNNPESLSSIPSDIQIISDNDNLVMVLVTLTQINELADLDFVEKITLPEKASLKSISDDVENPNDFSQNEYLIIIFLLIIILIAIMIIVKFKKK